MAGGPNGTALPSCLIAFAETYSSMADHDAALQYYNRLVGMSFKSNGEHHATTAAYVNSAGLELKKLSRCDVTLVWCNVCSALVVG